MIDKKYCTIKQLAEDEELPFTEPMIRYYLQNSEKFGLTHVIRKIGRKVIVRKDLFLDWVESHYKSLNEDMDEYDVR